MSIHCWHLWPLDQKIPVHIFERQSSYKIIKQIVPSLYFSVFYCHVSKVYINDQWEIQLKSGFLKSGGF